MFGIEPGAERRQGVMNEHIVSRILTRKIAYWVIHTRGESAVSVLITAITKEAQRRKMSAAEVQQHVNDLVSTAEEAKPYVTKEMYDLAKDIQMLAWGTVKDAQTLDSLVNTATSSCVLGYCLIGGSDGE